MVIGFSSLEYGVIEVAGDVLLSVEVLQGRIDQGEAIWVNFTTEDGTALGKQLPNTVVSILQ